MKRPCHLRVGMCVQVISHWHAGTIRVAIVDSAEENAAVDCGWLVVAATLQQRLQENDDGQDRHHD